MAVAMTHAASLLQPIWNEQLQTGKYWFQMLPIEFKKSCVHETPSPHGQDALKISLRDFSSTLEGVVLHDVMGNSGGTQSGNYCFLVRTDSFLCWKKKYLLERRQIRKKVI